MDLPGDTFERNFSIEAGERVVDSQAGLLSPQGGNALPRLVNRTVEVDEKQWLDLHKNSQSEPVQDNVEKAGRIPRISKGSTRRLFFWHGGLPIMNPYAQAYAWWCAFVLLMDATYTAFVVPIGVGFNTSSIQWNWVGYWDFIAGVTFAVELMLNWSVAFVATRNLRKRIVLRRRKIAHFYIWHSTFIFDLISTLVFIIQCVGYGLGSAGSSSGSIIQTVQILRALRLLRLLKLLQQLFVMSLTAPQTRVPLINKTVPVWLSYLGQLAYIVGLFLNFLACLWVFVAYRAGMSNTWVNNYTPFVSAWSSDPTADTLTKAEVDLIPGPEIYLAAAYWSLTAITTIGFGDITPITNAERAVILLVEILGVLFFGILLGSITSLLQRASQEVKEAQMFREKMGHVTEWMQRAQLPRHVKEKIRCYYSEVWVRQKVVENDLNLFNELPTHLRAQVAWSSNKPILDKIYILKDLSADVQYMITGRAKPTKVPPGHEICSQGDIADSIWLLHEGDVVAIYHYQEGETEKGPAIVGESALLAASQGQYRVRPCGYRALTACVLWEVTMQDLQPIVDSHQQVADMLVSIP